MTPTVAELLNGCILSLMTPTRPEDAGLFSGARIRLTALINKLVSIECLEGTAARVWENTALRALIVEAGPRYGLPSGTEAETADGDYSLAALDDANAGLRRLLTRLHEAAELSSDSELDRKILKLYREMAKRRELPLSPVRPMA